MTAGIQHGSDSSPASRIWGRGVQRLYHRQRRRKHLLGGAWQRHPSRRSPVTTPSSGTGILDGVVTQPHPSMVSNLATHHPIGAEVDTVAGIEFRGRWHGERTRWSRLQHGRVFDGGGGNDQFQGGYVSANDTFVGGQRLRISLLRRRSGVHYRKTTSWARSSSRPAGTDSLSGIESVVSTLMTNYLYTDLPSFSVLRSIRTRTRSISPGRRSRRSRSRHRRRHDNNGRRTRSPTSSPDERFIFPADATAAAFHTEANFFFSGPTPAGSSSATTPIPSRTTTRQHADRGPATTCSPALGGNDSVSGGAGTILS